MTDTVHAPKRKNDQLFIRTFIESALFFSIPSILGVMSYSAPKNHSAPFDNFIVVSEGDGRGTGVNASIVQRVIAKKERGKQKRCCRGGFWVIICHFKLCFKFRYFIIIIIIFLLQSVLSSRCKQKNQITTWFQIKHFILAFLVKRFLTHHQRYLFIANKNISPNRRGHKDITKRKF